MRKRGFTFFSILLIAISIALISAWVTYRFVAVDRTVEQRGALVEQVQSLEHLATADVLTKAVIEREDYELFGKKLKIAFPGTKRKLLVVIPGRVQAGIDFSKVKEEEVQYDFANKTLHLALPRATWVGGPEILFDEIDIYSYEGLLRTEAKIEEAYELAEAAKKEILRAAEEEGALELAEEHAEQFIQKALGIQDVQVEIIWKEEKKE